MKRKAINEKIREYHNHCLVVYEAWDISHSVNNPLDYSLSLSLFTHFVLESWDLRWIYMKIKFYKHTPQDNVKKKDGQTSKNMYIKKKDKDTKSCLNCSI